jgi:hypothetical protein
MRYFRYELQVWDYVGDGYVHRLIQSSLDGKLVEVPSPEPSTIRGWGNGAGIRDAGGPSTAGLGSKTLPAVEEGRALNEDMNMLEVLSGWLFGSFVSHGRANTIFRGGLKKGRTSR